MKTPSSTHATSSPSLTVMAAVFRPTLFRYTLFRYTLFLLPPPSALFLPLFSLSLISALFSLSRISHRSHLSYLISLSHLSFSLTDLYKSEGDARLRWG